MSHFAIRISSKRQNNTCAQGRDVRATPVRAGCDTTLDAAGPFGVFDLSGAGLRMLCASHAEKLAPELAAVAERLNAAGVAPAAGESGYGIAPTGGPGGSRVLGIECRACGGPIAPRPLDIGVVSERGVVPLCACCSHERAPSLSVALHQHYGTSPTPRPVPEPPPPPTPEQLAEEERDAAAVDLARALWGHDRPDRAVFMHEPPRARAMLDAVKRYLAAG